MTRYKNLNGDSNVAYYEVGAGEITVHFNDGSVYLYTSASAGASNVATMVSLADAGRGLNSFINRVVKRKYARKVR